MSREQLDYAYQLIQEGQINEAINIIEPIIRADRDNENAWWLLANATKDPAAKRNACQNVIRLSENAERIQRAQEMLAALKAASDTFDNYTRGVSDAESVAERPQAKGGRMSLGKVVLMGTAILGLCAFICVISAFWIGGPLVDAFEVPTEPDIQGMIEGSDTVSGSLSLDDPIDSYTYTGQAGDVLNIRATSNGLVAPYIYVYDTNTGEVVMFAQASSPGGSSVLNYTLKESSNYLISFRSFALIGQEMGNGEYSAEIDIRS